MILNLAAAYLIGSIPFGLILSEVFGKGNLREKGSGNIGATNVLRTQGKLLGLATFLLDFLKAYAACRFFSTENENVNLLILAAPVIGHMFPVWLKFKGGKGVASYFGVLFFLNPLLFLGTILVWCTVFLFTKISSISGLVSIIASICIFSAMKYFEHAEFLNQSIVLSVLAVLIIIKHKQNIIRLIKHEENSCLQH